MPIELSALCLRRVERADDAPAVSVSSRLRRASLRGLLLAAAQVLEAPRSHPRGPRRASARSVGLWLKVAAVAGVLCAESMNSKVPSCDTLVDVGSARDRFQPARAPQRLVSSAEGAERQRVRWTPPRAAATTFHRLLIDRSQVRRLWPQNVRGDLSRAENKWLCLQLPIKSLAAFVRATRRATRK